MTKIISALFAFLFLFSCTATKSLSVKKITSLKFIGGYLLPDETMFSGTRVGGLSGIDYNPADGLYYLISDDRSEYNPARYYTAKIFLSATALDSVRFQQVVFLRQGDGTFYPDKKHDSLHVPDPEGLRVNSKTGKLVWSNEGERIVRKEAAILQNPSVNGMEKDGRLTDTFALPANLHVSAMKEARGATGYLKG